jgi:hypothetical protein
MRFEFEFGTFQFLPLSLFRLENRICLFRGVQVAGVALQIATRIVARVEDLM